MILFALQKKKNINGPFFFLAKNKKGAVELFKILKDDIRRLHHLHFFRDLNSSISGIEDFSIRTM